MGTFLGAPYKKNYNILGSVLGSPYLGKLPDERAWHKATSFGVGTKPARLSASSSFKQAEEHQHCTKTHEL